MNVDLLPELGGVEHRFDDLGGDVTIHVADAGPADGAPVMLVHGFPQNWWGVTVVGHSLGGGVAMQFAYQHPDYCQRLILISSGGLGPDLGRTLRILSAPGAEFVLPVIAPRPVLTLGNKLRSWFASAGIQSPRGGELWNAYSSLSDRQTQQAFLRTLRAVVDYRGQAVSALNRLDELPPDLPTMAIWGDQDRIIPVEHGYAAYAARPGIRLEVLAGVGHFPHVECPTQVVDLIEDFIGAADRRSILDRLQRTRKTHPTRDEPRD